MKKSQQPGGYRGIAEFRSRKFQFGGVAPIPEVNELLIQLQFLNCNFWPLVGICALTLAR